MSNYVNNLNELINTKNEFKEIIIESGQTPGEVFSYYPNMIRNAIAAGGGSLVDYPTYTYVATYYPDFTYLFSYVGDALSGIDVDIDLSSYVTKDELSAQSYVTSTDLENASYVTYSYVYNNYVKKGADITTPAATIGNLRVEGELKVNSNTYSYNIIPQENNTYTLGDDSHFYYSAYIVRLRGDSSGIWLDTNTNHRYYAGASEFKPYSNNQYNLGTSAIMWKATYTTNIYTENVSYTSDKTSIKMNDRNIDFYANNKKMINLSDYNGFVPIQTNVNLGGSSNKWGSTYTSNLYADTIHNFIWTGTSAEYAALDNYTTYQIYMIKEA